MNTFKTRRAGPNGLYTVTGIIELKSEITLALDTGCTHTTLDTNTLRILGITLSAPIDTVLVQTANGIVRSSVFPLNHLSALGLQRADLRVQAYDFLGHGMLTEYDGILGLDFLQGTNFCINTRDETITIS